MISVIWVTQKGLRVGGFGVNDRTLDGCLLLVDGRIGIVTYHRSSWLVDGRTGIGM